MVFQNVSQSHMKVPFPWGRAFSLSRMKIRFCNCLKVSYEQAQSYIKLYFEGNNVSLYTCVSALVASSEVCILMTYLDDLTVVNLLF